MRSEYDGLPPRGRRGPGSSWACAGVVGLLSWPAWAGYPGLTVPPPRGAARPVVAGRALSVAEVRDPRIDVSAQLALLRLSRSTDPAAASDATSLWTAVVTGALAGIHGDDVRAAADRARARGTVRWELLAPGQPAAVIDAPLPPMLIYRAYLHQQAAALDLALRRAWARSGVTPLSCDVSGSIFNEAARLAPSASAPGACNESAEIARAVAQSRLQHIQALRTLMGFLVDLRGGGLLAPKTDAELRAGVESARTLEVVERRLRVSLSDRSLLIFFVESAKGIIDRNLRSFGDCEIKRDDAFCQELGGSCAAPTDCRDPGSFLCEGGRCKRANAWAWGDVGRPASGPPKVRLCQPWFDALRENCQVCSVDVIAHEVLHTNGLIHDASTPLRDANTIAQLIAELATGLSDACAKYTIPRCHKQCNAACPP